MVRDLAETIASGPEIILETGGKQMDPETVHGRDDKEIGLENKGFPYNDILNIFLFIIGIFNRDHRWLDRGCQFEDLSEGIVTS